MTPKQTTHLKTIMKEKKMANKTLKTRIVNKHDIETN